MKFDKNAKEPKGIVRPLDEGHPSVGGDEQFPPDYTVTSTTDGGGKVLTNVEVILVFWGKFWSSTPPPSPTADQYKTAIEGILTGPYMGGLRQYRGVGQGTLIYTDINDSSDPNNPYSDSDVVNVYGGSRSLYGSTNSYRDPFIDRQTSSGPFDHDFFFDSGTGPRGGDAPYPR